MAVVGLLFHVSDPRVGSRLGFSPESPTQAERLCQFIEPQDDKSGVSGTEEIRRPRLIGRVKLEDEAFDIRVLMAEIERLNQDIA